MSVLMVDQRDSTAQAVLRCRGLPFTATHNELLEFFEGFNIIEALITKADGKPNGQAFVLLPSAEAIKAQVELNNKYMGKRFIEVFSSTISDMETARRMCADHKHQQQQQQQQQQQKPSAGSSLSSSSSTNNSQRCKQNTGNLHIIRLRGLPFSATPADIKAFLAPIQLPDGISSIQMARHPDLRPTGEAYVHLTSETEVMQALNKHKQMMGKRYIEVFPSCLAELQQSMAPSNSVCYQQVDQHSTGPNLLQAPVLGTHAIPTGNPAAQAAWLQRQQQLLQLQQQMQLQAAAQQKMLANLQQQRQAASLRMQAQLQAQAQALPTMLQQMHVSDLGSGPQQQQDAIVAKPGLPVLSMPKQQQLPQQQVLVLTGLSAPMVPVPAAAVSMHSGSIAVVSPSIGGGAGGCGSGATMGGLACTAAAAATATCSPSPLDVQYVPFFCSANAAPMPAQFLQDMSMFKPSSLHMMSPSCPTGLLSLTNSAQQHPVLAGELVSSSANTLDNTAWAAGSFPGTALQSAAPSAFCSDPMLQGMASGPLSGGPAAAYLRQSVLNRADAPGAACQEWLP